MTDYTLNDLQVSVQDRLAFKNLTDYMILCEAFLVFLERANLTRIVSPTHHNYFFYQYDETHDHKITRPLNTDLFIESVDVFHHTFETFIDFLLDLKKYQEAVLEKSGCSEYIKSNNISKIVYTIQQSIGSIGDSFHNPNQSRKRIGQLFERLIGLIIQQVGLECQPRTINIPIPDNAGYYMSYELDVVFSRNKAILTVDADYISHSEIVGSIKTTSKDRLDKIFLDKYLLTKFIGRDIPVVAIFLHDVQRALRGNSIFGVNTTFKTNHFLGYTVALNKLDGVYYVDPRPEMLVNRRLREQIFDFQQFLVRDIWKLSSS
ncbi:MAG TPA: hypothetical protein VFA09_09430 [Ktedonobacteraceae bacterium]|nr:hypothetical protein [Ktedonobacteraceae bacterium]